MSVRHETKFIWFIEKDYKTGYFKTENDLAEDAGKDDLYQDQNIILYGSEGTESEAELISERVASEIKLVKLDISTSNNKDYYDL